MPASPEDAQRNPKDLAGSAKPGIECLPLAPMLEAGQVCRHGAAKYGPHNWRDIAIRPSAYLSSTFRHLALWWEGQDIDPESGLHHIAHAIAGLAILRDAQLCGEDDDDRPRAALPDGWMAAMANAKRSP